MEFIDEDFKRSIKEGLEMGNTVNKRKNSHYSFNLGCYEDGIIKGNNWEKNEFSVQYMKDDVMNAILNSTKDSTVSIILTYLIHQSRGCTCCNLMNEIELY